MTEYPSTVIEIIRCLLGIITFRQRCSVVDFDLCESLIFSGSDEDMTRL